MSEKNKWFLSGPCKHEIYKPGIPGELIVTLEEDCCPWCLKNMIDQLHSELEEQARLLGISGSREAKLLAELEEARTKLKTADIRHEHMLMFFQVATDNLGFDPSCEQGKLDPMCTADAIRGLKAELEEARKELVVSLETWSKENQRLEELNKRAKDVLEKTLDCEAAACVARNRLEIELASKDAKLGKALELLEKSKTGSLADLYLLRDEAARILEGGK